MEIADTVREMIGPLCSCTVTEGQINSGRFDCQDTNSDQTVVFFRAALSGSNEEACSPLLSAIEEWVESGVSLNVLGETLIVDSTCQVEISSVSVPVACQPGSITIPEDEPLSGALIGGITAGVVVVILVALIILFCCVARRSKLKR